MATSATGGTLVAAGLYTGNPYAIGGGLALIGIGGILQIWDVSTTPAEQIEEIKNSEDMETIKENMDNINELLEDKGKSCPQ